MRIFGASVLLYHHLLNYTHNSLSPSSSLLALSIMFSPNKNKNKKTRIIPK